MTDSPITDFARSRDLLIATAAIFLLPVVAGADPVFGGFVTTVPTVQNSPTPVVLSGSEDLAGRHGEGAIRAANTLGGNVLAFAPAHGLSGSFETFSFDATGVYDDIVITGPVAGASVPFTLHLPIRVDFFQDYSSITFASGVDASQPSNNADFQADLFTPTAGTVQGRLDLHTLIDASDTADILLTGQVVPTGDPGPTSTETLDTGITIFHNVPLGTGGFLNLFSRTQIPITSSGGPLGAGAGFSDQDIVELRAEILLSGTATVGTPLTLSLVLSGVATASGTTDQSASSSMDAPDGFSVPQDGTPVFDLPPGFSAESASLGVVDNVAPEPGGLAASATALVAVGRRRRRHRRETGGARGSCGHRSPAPTIAPS